MPKFSMDINGVDQGAAEGREAWGGELPPTGNYTGVLKAMTVGVIGSGDNAGKPKLSIGVELRNTPENGKYDGYLAWGNLNLIDPSIPYINQFLIALTDGSDEEFNKIKKAFYDDGFDTDTRKKHVTAIGKYKVNSPNGELPISVALKTKPWYNEKTKQTEDQVRLESYLIGGGATPSGGGVSEAPEEEAVSVVVGGDDDDENILDDE